MTHTDEQADLEQDDFPSTTDAAAKPAADAADLADGPAEEAADPGVAPEVDAGALEALLLSTHHPLTAAQVADVLELPGSKGVKRAIAGLNAAYEATGRSFRIEQVAGGYQILTLPQFGAVLQKLHAREADTKLTKAAQETLAVIAYKQPVLRTDVEAIRGVSCGETIRSLMEKRLVKISGRAELPGRPILYGTTRRFLESFGLNSLKDLPQPEGLARRAEEAAAD